jgi:hypothetical protein
MFNIKGLCFEGILRINVMTVISDFVDESFIIYSIIDSFIKSILNGTVLSFCIQPDSKKIVSN